MAEAAALIISILGAESTGKTTLAAALAARLSSQGVPRVAWVPELLREWCAAGPGRSLGRLAARIDALGLAVSELDPVTGWFRTNCETRQF